MRCSHGSSTEASPIVGSAAALAAADAGVVVTDVDHAISRNEPGPIVEVSKTHLATTLDVVAQYRNERRQVDSVRSRRDGHGVVRPRARIARGRA